MELVIKALETAIQSAEWNVNHYTEKVNDYIKYRDTAVIELEKLKEEISKAKEKLGIVNEQ